MSLLLSLALLGQIQVSIEARHLSPSGAMPVRFTIENTGAGSVDADEPSDWLAGLEIRDGQGKVLKESAASAPARKVRLEGRAFTGRWVDIAPALAGKSYEEGVFKLTWRHAGAVSASIDVPVIRNYSVKVETNLGDFAIDLFPAEVPANVLHFVGLVRDGFYDGKNFYAVIPGYLAQGGNPRADGKGSDPRTVKGEFGDRKLTFGAVAMSHPDRQPDAASTDFFIVLAPELFSNEKYTVIGQVSEGVGTLHEMEKVKSDHSPCSGCGKELEPRFEREHCGLHHRDRPQPDIIVKKVTLTERKD